MNGTLFQQEWSKRLSNPIVLPGHLAQPLRNTRHDNVRFLRERLTPCYCHHIVSAHGFVRFAPAQRYRDF